MSTQNEFAVLERELLTMSPLVRTNLTTFDSGAADIGVRVGLRFFVVTFVPCESGFSFGVDEVLDGEGLNMGYNHCFTDFTSARHKLIEMVRAALDTNKC